MGAGRRQQPLWGRPNILSNLISGARTTELSEPIRCLEQEAGLVLIMQGRVWGLTGINRACREVNFLGPLEGARGGQGRLLLIMYLLYTGYTLCAL